VGSVERARELGAEALVLGIAPPGGLVPDSWYPVIDSAVQTGMSIVNGLHDLLAPRYPCLAAGQFVWDVREEPADLMPGLGSAATLTNKRVLMIGTDMAIGKMTAGLQLQKALLGLGVAAEFVATGQIGITVTGAGVPLDAVRVDYASGAIEREVLRHKDADVVIVEGQGALIHPGSTANLPLMRGSMPTHFVLCHRAGQTHLMKMRHIPIPPIGDYLRLYEDVASACGTFPRPATLGIALNTFHIEDDGEAMAACEALEDEVGLPVCDPVRHGAERLAALLRE
jgi:uncharacterized NAD-dependent epimerase/dehydratase family protein